MVRIEHLNDVLRAIRNVNQLIVRERDPDTLAQEACRLLSEARQYHSVWLALWGADGRPRTVAGNGLGPHFEALADRLKSGNPPLCVATALSSSGVHVVRNRAEQCGDCPLPGADEEIAGMFVRLEHEDTIYGVLSIAMPAGYVDDEEESDLVREIAGDIAYALHALGKGEEARRNRERAEHLNEVLKAIRNVNQLIVREKDTDALIRRACELLVETRGYYSSWIALLDSECRYVTGAQADVGDGFEGIVARLKEGDLMQCGVRALKSDDVQVVYDPVSGCSDCPLSERYAGRAGMSVRLKHGDAVYGILTVSVPARYAHDEEESALLGEIAGDIAYALHGIEQRRALDDAMARLMSDESQYRRHTTDRTLKVGPPGLMRHSSTAGGLKVSNYEQRLGALIQVTTDWVWQVDASGVYEFVSENVREIMGYAPPEVVGKRPFDFMTPEEAERVGAIFGAIVANKEPIVAVEDTLITHDGTPLIFETNGLPLLDEDGEVRGYFGTCRNVTDRKRAEAALRQSEEEYRRLFEQSRDAIYLITADGRITNVNAAAARLFGYSREELVSMQVQSLYADPSIRPEVIAEALEHGGLQDYELAFKRKDGNILECLVTTTVLRNAEGTFVGFQTVIRDVTEQKRLEEALRQSEEHYRSIFEQSMDALYLVDVDGHASEANQPWLDMFGYTREDLPVLSASDVYVDPSEREEFLQKIDDDEYVEDDVLMKRKDGSVFTCHRTVVPRRDSTGAIVAFQGIMRDVTEQRRIEEALQDREQKYRSLFEQAREAIAIVAPEGTVLDANQTWLDLFGYERKDLPGLNITDLYADPRQRDDFLRRMTEDGYVEDELWYRRRDGTPILCNRSVKAWKNEYGMTVAFQSFVRDITEERRLQQELQTHTDQLRLLAQRVQVAREEERTGIARELHDRIGQEITALKLDVLQLRAGLQAEGSAQTGQIEGIEHLLDEAADDVRRISSELRPGVLDDIGLAGAIEWQVAELRKRTDISFAVKLPHEMPELDESRRTALFRVFQELLTNVVRHARANAVEVEIDLRRESVVMSVSDNGRGVSASELEDSSSIGIVGMRERLQPFGGELHYETAPGEGTTARVVMPLSKA